MSTTPMTPAPPAVPAGEKPKAQEEREYIVFGRVESQMGDKEAWAEIDRAKGKTADEAEDKVVDALPTDEQGGPFVTIAVRYWNPVSYELETTTTTTRKRK